MKKLTLEEFITAAKNIHGKQYDYSNTIYINSKVRVEIICTKHGSFFQIPTDHIYNKAGCPTCGRERCSQKQASNTKEFIEKASSVHNHIYDYSDVKYIKASAKITIICPIHGSFYQKPDNHLSGRGCRICQHDSMRTTNFEEKAEFVHNNKYDYSLINYINNYTKIDIICPIHGIFKQKPGQHLLGKGCKLCGNNYSKSENNWLDSLNIPKDKKHRQVSITINNKNIVVDGYESNTNTIYEFLGDYWHGNPILFNPTDYNKNNNKQFGQLLQETINRAHLIKSAGFNLIEIWEEEYKILKKGKNNATI